MKTINFSKQLIFKYIYVCLAVALVFAGCKKDKDDNGNPEIVTPTIKIEGFSLANTSSSVTLNEGDVLKINYEVTPAVLDTAVTWASSDVNVATVSNSGRITAIKHGNATITGSCMGLTVKINVEVKEIFITDFNVSETEKTVYTKLSNTVEIINITPNKALAENINVIVENPELAIAEIKGKKIIIKGVAEGTTKVTLSYENSNENKKIEKTIDIIVLNSLNKTELNLVIGSTYKLTTNLVGDVKWESSNPEIATVNQEGMVSAVGAGTAKIILTVDDKKVECIVSIISSITLNKETIELYMSDEDSKIFTLIPTIKPSEAANASITWSSTDESVAIVNDAGKVTAVGKGTTKITAIVGDKKAECEVIVSLLNGKLPGKFSVSETKQIQFSQGNLQYQASTKLWRFGENQYSVVGTEKYSSSEKYGNVANSDNVNISATYSGWIDLFGYGTSGYNDKYPYMTSENAEDYDVGSIAETEYDWGIYNAISNGGNKKNMWRILTLDEWTYLIEKRQDASNKYGASEVAGIEGFVILPDNWILPDGLTFKSGLEGTSWANYTKYTEAEWQKMEAAGAVFLPVSGFRRENLQVVSYHDYFGFYWTTSKMGGAFFYFTPYKKELYYCIDNEDDEYYQYSRLSKGLAVRLVTD